MSKLYLGSDPRGLADTLADELDEQARRGDFFVPPLVVVPNRYLRKWLRLWLARRLDGLININFQYLEDALWLLLRQLDPATKVKPEPIDENMFRLMVLAVLLEEQEPALGPLRRYLHLQGPNLSRLSCRRAWYLADRLGLLLRDYEYHRQDTLIQRWLRDEPGLEGGGDFHQIMERAQRVLFQHTVREKDGRRALLNRLAGRSFKTLPEYAQELMRLPPPLAGAAGAQTVHFFGFTQITELHGKAIGWLGQFHDVRFYHLNVAARGLHGAQTAETLKGQEETLRQPGQEDDKDPGRVLLRSWGLAGIEALTPMENLLEQPSFTAEALAAYEPAGRAPRRATVLSRLQDSLLGKQTPRGRLVQDTSLQIAGCAGVAREVETVHNSILDNLQRDRSLRQTDIAILVTDMVRYRAPLQAVFERPPARLQFNMVDFNAAGISMFGQALVGMLDLALESFSRTRVFSVILNPCFLARLGVEREQAMIWLEWAESLGIFQGWDADEKQQQGYAPSHFYAWRLGLQRLRLGRYMDVARDDAGEPAPRFGHVIPFADLASTDREQLDAFCIAVEGLLPELARLRSAPASGQRWAHVLQRLVQDFLDVPADRPEEAQVRDELLGALEKLAYWDLFHDAGRRPGLPLALVRDYLQGQLEVLAGNRGEYLIGGVTISGFQPMRPVPFEIIYVLGLGEDLFPGSNALSSFDLRGARRMPGDIHPAEDRLYDFLATILAAQRKLYLLYNNHDLQKDQPLLPAAPLQQLQRFLQAHILQGTFQPIGLPPRGDDLGYIDPAEQPAYQDLIVQYDEAERFLALRAAERAQRLALDGNQQAEWSSKCRTFQRDFSIVASSAIPGALPRPEGNIVVSLHELKRFLELPAEASLRRHLHIDEDDTPALEDQEPVVASGQAAQKLIRESLQQLVSAAAKENVEQALASWQERFTQAHADARLRSRVPEDAFGEIDQASIRGELHERIHGQGGLEAFLREHADMSFCGPVLLGNSTAPLGARWRFPALRLRPGHELPDAAQEIRITGWTVNAWFAPDRFDVLILTNSSKTTDGRKIVLPMIEPALLHMAMIANATPNAGGSAQSMVAHREFRLHVAHVKGIQTWTYPVNSITPDEALHYFVELTRDFLDPAQFDLLPFEALYRNYELERALDSNSTARIPPDTYRKGLENAIADLRENKKYGWQLPLLVDMIDARVPADALAKVQRRFRLLDRAPARIRQQPVRRPRKVKEPSV
jgi:exonuclease V gamma subunit